MSERPRLLLIRHGQGSLGTDNYDQLSPVGYVQSEKLGAHLASVLDPASLVVCGHLQRHRQTLDGLNINAPARFDASLNEYTVDQLIRSAMDQADDLGLAVPDASAFDNPKAYLDTFLSWFPGVLSHWQAERLVCQHNGRWQDFHARVCAPLADWHRVISSGRSVLAVTSAGVISTMCAHAIGQPLGWQRECNVSLYNASMTALSIDADGQWQLDELNTISHLDDATLHTLA